MACLGSEAYAYGKQTYVEELLPGSLSLLSQKDIITIEDIPLESIDDFISLIYMVIYASKSDTYDIEYDEEMINVSGVKFRRFTVRGNA